MGLPEDIDVGAGNASIANNVTVSDEEVNEDEVMVSQSDALLVDASSANETLDIIAEAADSAEANGTLDLNAEVIASAEVNTESFDPNTEGHDNTEGLSTVEAFDRIEANHTEEALDTSVLADDIVEAELNGAEAELNDTEVEVNLTDTAVAEESVKSTISDENILVLDNSAGDQNLSTTVEKVSSRRKVDA